MGNSPGQAITIPDNEVIRDEDVQREGVQAQQPSWYSLASNGPLARFAGSALQSAGLPRSIEDIPSWASRGIPGLDKNATVLPSGKDVLHSVVNAALGGVPDMTRQFMDVATEKDLPTALGKVAGPAGMAFAGAQAEPAMAARRAAPPTAQALPPISKWPAEEPQPITLERDATKLNTPFAGEAEPGPQSLWRDATRQNVPFAGEEPEPQPVRAMPQQGGGESVAGTRPRSLVLTPEEAAAEAQMQRIAKQRASERGMQFAGGMTPREGRSVPRYPQRADLGFESPNMEEIQRSVASPFEKPLDMSTDSLGLRWASDGKYRVTIPKSVPEEGIEAYARQKLAEQAQIHGGITNRAAD